MKIGTLHECLIATVNYYKFQAKREMMGRDLMKTDLVCTHEEVPYFFFLKCEQDIDIGIEHDDEKIFLPDLTRERISSNHVNLFYDLTDKPGKGGKPWK